MSETRQQRLQRKVESIGLDGTFVEWRPFRGWYLCFNESRWIGDEGDFIGSEYHYAEAVLVIENYYVNRAFAEQSCREQLSALVLGTRKHDEALKCSIRKMAYEEVCYWLAKCDGTGKRYRAGRKAFRILFAAVAGAN